MQVMTGVRARGSGSRVGALEIYRRAGRAHSVCRCTSPSYEGEAASAPRSNNPYAHNRKRPSRRRSAVLLSESGKVGMVRPWVRNVRSYSRLGMPIRGDEGRDEEGRPTIHARHLNLRPPPDLLGTCAFQVCRRWDGWPNSFSFSTRPPGWARPDERMHTRCALSTLPRHACENPPAVPLTGVAMVACRLARAVKSKRGAYLQFSFITKALRPDDSSARYLRPPL